MDPMDISQTNKPKFVTSLVANQERNKRFADYFTVD